MEWLLSTWFQWIDSFTPKLRSEQRKWGMLPRLLWWNIRNIGRFHQVYLTPCIRQTLGNISVLEQVGFSSWAANLKFGFLVKVPLESVCCCINIQGPNLGTFGYPTLIPHPLLSEQSQAVRVNSRKMGNMIPLTTLLQLCRSSTKSYWQLSKISLNWYKNIMHHFLLSLQHSRLRYAPK